MGQEAVREKEFQEFKETVEVNLIERERRLVQVVLDALKYRKMPGPYRKASLTALAWTVFGTATKTTFVAGLGIAGFLGLALAWQANSLLRSQNERIDIQTHLAEAQRRSSLIFELTSILDQLRIDRDGQDAGSTTDLYEPSTELGARIVALSRSLRPYYFVSYPTDTVGASTETASNDESILEMLLTIERLKRTTPYLGSRPLSPERAQLLLSLSASRVDFQSVSMQGATFAYSDLSGNTLYRLAMYGADLTGASMRNTSLIHVDFTGENDGSPTRLDDVDFTCANFSGVEALSATLDRTKFAHVAMKSFNFINSPRSGDFPGNPVSIDFRHLSRADLTDADFHGVELGSQTLWFSPEYEGNFPIGFERERWLLQPNATGKVKWRVVDTRKRSEVEAAKNQACR